MTGAYVRTDDGALMVRRSSHQYVSADWALSRRLSVNGRLLTREAINAMKEPLAENTVKLEAAE